MKNLFFFTLVINIPINASAQTETIKIDTNKVSILADKKTEYWA